MKTLCNRWAAEAPCSGESPSPGQAGAQGTGVTPVGAKAWPEEALGTARLAGRREGAETFTVVSHCASQLAGSTSDQQP